MPLPFPRKKVGPSAGGQHHCCCCHVFRNPWETTAAFGCTGVCACKHVNTYECRECRLTSGVVPQEPAPLVVWIRVSDWYLGVLIRLGSQASKTQGSACLCLPRSGITRREQYMWLSHRFWVLNPDLYTYMASILPTELPSQLLYFVVVFNEARVELRTLSTLDKGWALSPALNVCF